MMEGQSAEEQIERRIDFLVRELDELCSLANNPETRDLVAAQQIGIGQIQFRGALILGFLKSHENSKLRMVKNHG
jgi:hypothetical protein